MVPSGFVLFFMYLGFLFIVLCGWDYIFDRVARANSVVGERKLRVRKIGLICLICTLAVGGMVYRLLYAGQLEQSALLFLGLPTVLSIVIVSMSPARSATGAIFRGITVALLMSGIVLGEGLVCILMSAPIFWLVGLTIGLLIDKVRRRGTTDDGSFYSKNLIFIPLILMSLEGITPELSASRSEQVSVTRIINATAEQVRNTLSKTPVFDDPLPYFLRLGFPVPETANGSGLEDGCTRSISFSDSPDSALKLVVSNIAPDIVRFEIVDDTTKIAHWLSWKSSTVQIVEAGPGTTRVTWTIAYDRELDPAWYFGPMERYAVRLAAGYLIDSTATPGHPDD